MQLFYNKWFPVKIYVFFPLTIVCFMRPMISLVPALHPLIENVSSVIIIWPGISLADQLNCVPFNLPQSASHSLLKEMKVRQESLVPPKALSA